MAQDRRSVRDGLAEGGVVIGKRVGIAPVARAYAQATAANAGATPSSPAPLGVAGVFGTTMTRMSSGVFHRRV